jgi:hypothetical protein
VQTLKKVDSEESVNGKRSTFNVQRSTFGVRRSAFGVREPSRLRWNPAEYRIYR